MLLVIPALKTINTAFFWYENIILYILYLVEIKNNGQQLFSKIF